MPEILNRNSKILILILYLQQYSTNKPDFHECRVFKKYDREGV